MRAVAVAVFIFVLNRILPRSTRENTKYYDAVALAFLVLAAAFFAVAAVQTI